MTSVDQVTRSSATIFGLALPPEAALSVVDAAEVTGFGFRQYSTADSLFESAPPAATGCMVIASGVDTGHDEGLQKRLAAHFFSMPVVVLLESDSAANAVKLMQGGAFSVVTKPYSHESLVATLNAAIDASVSSQSAVDEGRDAALRMDAATAKEREVLNLILAGRKNKEIAKLLGITIRAVEDRRFRLMKKLQVESVAALVTTAVKASYFEKGYGSPVRQSVTATPRQCIKGIEVWEPTDDDKEIRLTKSCYRDAASFHEASRNLTFRRGEGLPGRIWEQGTPAFLKELITTEFVRRDIAGAAGVTTAIGLPIFANGKVKSVVLILLDSRHQMKTVFELWSYDASAGGLTLAGGTYINCERLRRLSEFVTLPIGEGLAGIAYEQSRPYVASQLADDKFAVRGLALAAEQLVSGVAIPLTDSGQASDDVLLLFNSDLTPMFSVLQLWKRNGGNELVLASEVIDGVPSLASQLAGVVTQTGSDIAEQAALSGGAVAVGNGAVEGAVACSNLRRQLNLALAIPTVVDGNVTAVCVLAN